MSVPQSVEDVVRNGLCIGCGLCGAIGPFDMAYTPEGRLRPRRSDAGSAADIMRACPGAVAAPNAEKGPHQDPIWGSYRRIQTAWAADADVRYRAATGGVLTALGMYLLRRGEARFVLHCGADPQRPMRSRWFLSETANEVSARAGSRYGPSDTLAGLDAALAREEPFAIIAKPCDAGAVRARAKDDPRIGQYLKALLVMVCGGASDLGKSEALLDEQGWSEDDVILFRYRGYGNPGPTRVETCRGEALEKTYSEMWADEAGWRIQSRCKICPDALGEAADIAAADVWPGGNPTGEDAGFNGVIIRTQAGEVLFDEAMAAGALVSGGAMTPEALSDTQPHQVSKKKNLAARLRGLRAAGMPVYAHTGLRIETLDAKNPAEQEGAFTRAKAGRFRETMPE